MKKERTDAQLAYHVSNVSIGANVLLTVGKIFAGVVANSGAMVTDGIHSATDVVGTLVGLIGIKLGDKEADKRHEYGHEKLECIVSFILGCFIFLTGLGIGLAGLEKIIGINNEVIAVPGILALIASVISILVKEGMYHYTIKKANQINSSCLKAQAWDHRSDAISSVGSFIGVGGAMLGFPILDPIASLIISCFIAKAAIEILSDSIDKLVDKSCEPEVEEKMLGQLNKIPGIYKVDNLKTRLSGSRVFVDTTISADANLSFVQSHQIAQNADNVIKHCFPEVKDCMIQVNPVCIKN